MNGRRVLAGVVLVCAAGVAIPALAFAQPSATPRTGDGLFKEPKAISRAAAFAEKRMGGDGSPDEGFFVETGQMITGSGWISAGPGYRRRVLGDRALFSTSAALSWRLYSMARVSLDVPRTDRSRVSYGVGVMYQDALQVNYFGLGNDSDRDARSGYRLRSFDTDAHASFTRGSVALQARAGWMPSIAVRPMAGWGRQFPDTDSLFTEDTAPGLAAQPSFVHADVGVTLDVRNQPSRPTRGGVYTATLTRYSDLDTGINSFNLTQVDATQYVPLLGSRWVAALRGWGAFTQAGSDQQVPFYLMPNVGGRSTIRGFMDYRFHGPQMIVFGAESRWALFDHVDTALFVDAGRVADRVADLRLSGLHTSIGAGIRFHTDRASLARLDVARSPEGWRLTFKLTEPFRRKTFSGNLSPTIPFVP